MRNVTAANIDRMCSVLTMSMIAVCPCLLGANFRAPDARRISEKATLAAQFLPPKSVMIRNELADGDGVPSDAQRARLEHADRLMKLRLASMCHSSCSPR
jgi:hypothetical protein